MWQAWLVVIFFFVGVVGRARVGPLCRGPDDPGGRNGGPALPLERLIRRG
jgi:hypothetical protein